MLSNFKHLGSYTINRGVIVLYNKNKVKIDDFHIIQAGSLISFRLQIHTEQVRILSCYVPSAGDKPEFFYQCQDILNLATEKDGLIIWD